HRRVADDPFARVVDIAPRAEVHHRVRAPADRPDHLVDFGGDIAGDCAVADVGVDLDQEIAADRHRLGFGVVDVAGDDRAAAGGLVADELGGDVVGDACAPVLPVARGGLAQALSSEVLARGDVFHLGGDYPAAGVVHLADVAPRLRAEHALGDVRERGAAARTVGAELAVVLGAHGPRVVSLD